MRQVIIVLLWFATFLSASLISFRCPDKGSSEFNYNNDPNEQRYCSCNEFSYGDMVACDNADVSLIFWSAGSISFGISKCSKGRLPAKTEATAK